MAIVKEVALCPACHIEIADSKAHYCPHCGKTVQAYKNSDFARPDYLSYQLSDATETAQSDKALSGDEHLKRLLDLKEAYLDWWRNCSDEDRMAALQDAFHAIEHLGRSNTRREMTKHIIAMGIKIGELAKSLDGYIKSGGNIFDGKTRQLQPEPRDDSWSAAATAGRGDPFGGNT